MSIFFGNQSFEDYPQEKQYPANFTDSKIKLFLKNFYIPKVVVQNVPKRNAFVKLLFLGSTLFQITKKFQ